jgi:hypothetical protein
MDRTNRGTDRGDPDSSCVLSVASPSATQPNGLIVLAYGGAMFLAAAVLSLGIGLIRAARLSQANP